MTALARTRTTEERDEGVTALYVARYRTAEGSPALVRVSMRPLDEHWYFSGSGATLFGGPTAVPPGEGAAGALACTLSLVAGVRDWAFVSLQRLWPRPSVAEAITWPLRDAERRAGWRHVWRATFRGPGGVNAVRLVARWTLQGWRARATDPIAAQRPEITQQPSLVAAVGRVAARVGTLLDAELLGLVEIPSPMKKARVR